MNDQQLRDKEIIRLALDGWDIGEVVECPNDQWSCKATHPEHGKVVGRGGNPGWALSSATYQMRIKMYLPHR